MLPRSPHLVLLPDRLNGQKLLQPCRVELVQPGQDRASSKGCQADINNTTLNIAELDTRKTLKSMGKECTLTVKFYSPNGPNVAFNTQSCLLRLLPGNPTSFSLRMGRWGLRCTVAPPCCRRVRFAAGRTSTTSPPTTLSHTQSNV